ncbi:MAG: hypothetical protein AAFX87_26110 [Bacteroidota bacterium]
MKKISLIIILIAFVSCSDSSKKPVVDKQYDNIFGEWEVTNAEFISGNMSLHGTDIDDQTFEEAYKEYTYRFFEDSTFERGKPTVRHGNVEEAHGKFSISSDEKTMFWNLAFGEGPEYDSIPIEIISISPTKIILNERLGGQLKILHVLERGN